jgi:hypothetical protein
MHYYPDRAICATRILRERTVTLHESGDSMATNPPDGPGRIGAVRDRSQTFNPQTQQWVKRDTDNGRFMQVKQDGTPFKGVRKEK